ncbi:hypothetical protein LNP18_07110 [Leuconostoc citreum]|uniref:hypothetical protein n=1 Tax=Leuconostoc citreum TaxID=33964 RepID=UPI00200B709A|nr:hypothetical protein [Leuconostoc citreum]MCK8605873.1 hypothetical protein [Leuconostoc citreum]
MTKNVSKYNKQNEEQKETIFEKIKKKCKPRNISAILVGLIFSVLLEIFFLLLYAWASKCIPTKTIHEISTIILITSFVFLLYFKNKKSLIFSFIGIVFLQITCNELLDSKNKFFILFCSECLVFFGILYFSNVIRKLSQYFAKEFNTKENPILKRPYFWLVTLLTTSITFCSIVYVVVNLGSLIKKIFGDGNLDLFSILLIFALSIYKQYTSFFPLYQLTSKNDSPSKTSDALIRGFIDLGSAYVLMTADILAITKQIKFINHLKNYSAIISIVALALCYYILLLIYNKLFKSEDEFYDFLFGQNKELNQCLLKFIDNNKSTTNQTKREPLCNIPVSKSCADFFMPNDVYNAFYKLDKAGFIKKIQKNY